METKHYTLNVRRPLTREEIKRRKEEKFTKLFCVIIGICLGILAGMLISSAIIGSVAAEPEKSASYRQVTGKLERPATTAVFLIDNLSPVEEEEEPDRTWDVPLAADELAALLDSCEAYNIAPEVIFGPIQTESSFIPNAVSSKDCYGYCQLNPRFFPSDLSPADNIRTGVAYLAEQLERYDGDMEAALTAYNAGYDTGSRTYAGLVLAAAATFERG